MEFRLKVRFYFSALDDRGPPTFDPEAPYRPQLMVASDEEITNGAGDMIHLGVEFLDVISSDGDSIDVIKRTLYPDVDYSLLKPGVEFFVLERVKMVGRGVVSQIHL